jgi:hypothetical protein
MKTIITIVYEFDELNDTAKERARHWYREVALDYDWWEYVYEDAAQIGLKIDGFDLDNGKHAEGELTVSVMECCKRILAQHGQTCATYKLAQRVFKDKRDGLATDPEEFTRDLLEEYATMLQIESEYLMSDESVDEHIRINEYTFTADGKREALAQLKRGN